jgi:phage gpG-like protein
MSAQTDLDEITRFFDEFQRRAENLSPVAADLGELGIASIQKNFRDGGRYGDGIFGGGSNKWREWSPEYKKNRAKAGRSQILIDKSYLRNSLAWRYESGSLIFTAGQNQSSAYAAIHNFGGRAGRNHTSLIPERPYMVLQDIDITRMLKIVTEYYAELLAGGS